jgi:hypothetical protein
MPTLSELLRQAAELQMRTWKAHEAIYAALGYSEFPPEHVTDAVGKAVEDAALALGTAGERGKLFRARIAIQQKRKIFDLPEEDACPFCEEPLGAPNVAGMRECPECYSTFDRQGAEARPE